MQPNQILQAQLLDLCEDIGAREADLIDEHQLAANKDRRMYLCARD